MWMELLFPLYIPFLPPTLSLPPSFSLPPSTSPLLPPSLSPSLPPSLSLLLFHSCRRNPHLEQAVTQTMRKTIIYCQCSNCYTFSVISHAHTHKLHMYCCKYMSCHVTRRCGARSSARSRDLSSLQLVHLQRWKQHGGECSESAAYHTYPCEFSLVFQCGC